MNAIMKTPASSTENDRRWSAIVARDAGADGSFWYSVVTTGVYCRPSCGSRRPKPENVRFHATREDAERAGFRACKRCKPDQAGLSEQHAALVTAACRWIEAEEKAPSLAELAKDAGLSPFHFHRVFKAVTGVTPKQYANAHRHRRVRTELERAPSVTDAVYDAGYNSSARFYEKSAAILGMRPREFRAGGANASIRFAVGQSSLGAILVAQSAQGICAILLGDDADELTRQLQDQFPNAELVGGDADFEAVVARVVGFVEAPQAGLDLPLDIRGTAFQQRVWQALRKIPTGTTASYADIAQRIGAPRAVRAVAAACAANALAVAIPCHRVIKRDGSVSGYRWGVSRKRALIAREAQ